MDLWCISIIVLFLQHGHFASGLITNGIITAAKLARINSTEDFFREFVTGSDFEITSRNDETEAMHISGQSENTATFDRCEPRYVTVPIEKDEDSNVVLWPPCTRVMRCSGCCPTDLLACEPIQTENVFMKVVRFRIPHQGSPEFVFDNFKTVMTQKHLKCDQRCRVKVGDCNPMIHDYLEDDCRCKCRMSRPDRCPTTKHGWQEQTCSCECVHRKSCGVFQRFDESTCECDIRQLISNELTEQEKQELRLALLADATQPPTEPPTPQPTPPQPACGPNFRQTVINGRVGCVPTFTWRIPGLRRRRHV